MLFRLVDKFIDRKVSSVFNYFRKLGRRSERVYYTAYQDWLIYTARRSHDNSVKITMGIMTICLFHMVLSFRSLFLTVVTYKDLSASSLEKQLEDYNRTQKVVHKDPIESFVSIKLEPKGTVDGLVYSEYLDQRDK